MKRFQIRYERWDEGQAKLRLVGGEPQNAQVLLRGIPEITRLSLPPGLKWSEPLPAFIQ
jgi:hypothetical protein